VTDLINSEKQPLFVQFEFCPEQGQIQTDESEAILQFEDSFGLIAPEDALPSQWKLTPADADGNAVFKVPIDSCTAYHYRQPRKNRYRANVKCRKYAA
jgi:hypothetical protein